MNRFDEQLKESFSGFEPEVAPDFAAFERKLNDHVDAGRSELSRRYRKARRVATASTAVALGLLGLLFLRVEESPLVEEEVQSGWMKFDGGGGNGMRPAFEGAGVAARTTNSVVISEASLQSEIEAVEASEPRTAVLPSAQPVRPVEERSSPTRGEGASAAGRLSDVADIEGNEARPLGFESSVQEACEGTEVTFKLDGDWAEGSFLWNFGDGTFSSESEPSHLFNRPGTYDITISVRSHNDGQIRTRTVENMIVVRPRPEAKLNWRLPKLASGNEVEVHLENQTERTSSSTWLIGEEKIKQSQVTLKVPGEYPIHLIASNAYGCQDHEMASLRLGDRLSAGAPSSFSPDGDGRYDQFLPRAAREATGAWVFRVFDHHDAEVFSTSNAQQPWTGLLNAGVPASRGRYHWTLEMIDRDGNTMMYTDEVRVE